MKTPKIDDFLDYPAAVHLETWTKCNAACDFCPYVTLERLGNKMPDALIEKILTDLEDIPKDHRFLFSPFKVNEPFLDKRMLPMLEDINKRLPNAILTLFTNGAPLTREKIKRIADLSNVRHLWISLNEHRPKQYEAVMKIPLARTVKKLDLLHSMSFPHKVVVSRVCDNTLVDQEFVMRVETRWPKFNAFLIKRDAWITSIKHDAISTEVPVTKCNRWWEIEITSTGRTALCCMDGHADYSIGDVSKRHVLEVYNSPGYKRMRAGSKTRQAYSPCNMCTY